MDQQLLLEIIGYVASALVAISLMMTRILRLRVINLVGSAVFTVYGILITAYPVAAVNGFIVLINVYHLYRFTRMQEVFSLLEIKPGSDYLAYFLSFYREDIERFQPGFRFEPGRRPLIVLVLRDLIPAGVLIGDLREDGVLDVALDFVIPKYRDFKIGRYLYHQEADFFRQRGITEIQAPPPDTPDHARYLRKMGFATASGDRFRLPVPAGASGEVVEAEEAVA